MILLDTHVVAWIYAGEVERLPPAVAQRLNAEAIAISPFVTLELQYLYEVGRVTGPAARVVDELLLT